MLCFGIASCERQLFGPGFEPPHLHMPGFPTSIKSRWWNADENQPQCEYSTFGRDPLKALLVEPESTRNGGDFGFDSSEQVVNERA
jgi:hypothetical protein